MRRPISFRSNFPVRRAVFAPYSLTSDSQACAFTFVSEGGQGRIPKQIEFRATREAPQVYNVMLYDSPARRPEDWPPMERSRNGDPQRVIATVIAAIDVFLQRHPERWVMFYSGRPDEPDPARMRLYRMGMAANLDFIRQRAVLYGILPDQVTYEPYEPARTYVALLLKSAAAPA